MCIYADRLRKAGYEVEYIAYDPQRPVNQVIAALAERGMQRLRIADPVDDLFERRIRQACQKHQLSLDVTPTPCFLTPLDWGCTAVGGKKTYRMATFYQAQRKRLNILVDAHGKPAGGAWSHDADNRRKWPRNRLPPLIPACRENQAVKEARHYVRTHFPEAPGADTPFVYPVTHADAQSWLNTFLVERLNGFGTYEDAMVVRAPVLHHSVLTPLLNTGLLTPQHVLDAVLDYAATHKVALNDLEGFIRQLIGWREFMRLMYVQIGRSQRTANFWAHERPVPQAFYTATTGVDPVDHVIQRVLDGAYAHHIERLMVLGNFMLLCGLHPDGVYRWFMEMFIDAYDWVMVPNVYGMSQFADGGWLCTKPYISGSNYIRKMSDFKTGPWCAIWDGLFWSFIARHRSFFEAQPRLSMMVRQLNRMAPATLTNHQQNAAKVDHLFSH